jgi:hypothetical protein
MRHVGLKSCARRQWTSREDLPPRPVALYQIRMFPADGRGNIRLWLQDHPPALVDDED